MKKYFDNILFFLQRSGGGSVYWGELMKRFNSFNSDSTTFIQPNAETSNIILPHLKLTPVLKEKSIPVSILRYLPLSISLPESAIFHSSYYRYTTQKSVSNFVTVHDFIYENYRSGVAKFIHAKQKAAAIKHSKGIVCISQNTRKDLLKYYPSLTRHKKIQIIYNGVSEDFKILPEEELRNSGYYLLFRQHNYLLYIGHRTVYKNFDFAIEVVKELPEKYKLAIVGNPLNEQELKVLQQKLGNRFLFLGNISNSQLNHIYNLSHCLLYPSNYEGFGIPILEANRSGCPVVAQNVSSIPEILSCRFMLVDGLNINDFKNKILALENSTLRSDIILEGYNNSLQFSWDKCFKELNDFYEICT
jgi:mannosyltransferase